MKKILIIFIALLLMQSAFAQTDSVRFHKSGNDEFVVTFGGYDIFMQAKGQEKTYHTSFGLISGVELGTSLLAGTDYAGYADKEFLDYRGLRSFHFGCDVLRVNVILNTARTLSLFSGVQLNCENYSLPDDITLKYVDDMVVPVNIGDGYKRSKLVATYLGVPLGLKIRLNSSVKFYAYGFVQILADTYTKYKKPVEKQHFSGLNPLLAGFGATMVIGDDIGIFAKYSPSDLFQSGKGPKTHPFSAGLYFDL